MSSIRGSPPPSPACEIASSPQKVNVTINVYDLLPPGRLASTLWAVGAALLHTGVVVNGREYAYGGHDRPNHTGVYWTQPRTEPPGGTFRIELDRGYSTVPPEEVEGVLRSASDEFQGMAYNLLTKNCNHFTEYLTRKLTGRSPPAWLNRAARIGVVMPCIVPREWIDPPDYEDADGELLDEDEIDNDERSAMLRAGTSTDISRIHISPPEEADGSWSANGRDSEHPAAKSSHKIDMPLPPNSSKGYGTH